MKKVVGLILISLFVLSQFSVVSQTSTKDSGGWKAGIARVAITPEESIWMAGYAARDHSSEGVLHDLWSKALAIEDKNGNRAIIISNDLVKIPKNISDRIRDRIGAKYGLKRAQIILNCSHTHSGPVLYDSFNNIYPFNDEQLGVVKAYSVKFENQIVELAGKALSSMVPAQIFAENGVTRFQVNRRNNVESLSNQLTELNGPNDYAVPVLKVVNNTGDLIAIAFGYACHATVLNFYMISGDYPGFAQIELEKSHPGVTALFLQGAGADQNPLPRRSVTLAVQYGRQLAAAVDRVIEENMRKLDPVLSVAYSEINLQYAGPLPTKSELLQIMSDSSSTPDYLKRSAAGLLQKLESGIKLKDSYPYPCQVWKLGDQPVMSLGGELLVEYAIELKKTFGPDIFVFGYSNDVMAYIPSETVLKEGGYEGTRSPVFTTAWNMNIQKSILDEMTRLAAKAGVKSVK